MNKKLIIILLMTISHGFFAQKPWKDNSYFSKHFPEKDTNFNLQYDFSAMGDLMYNNFEYKISAEFYEQADSLNSRQLINHSLCYYNNNDFNNAVPLFEIALNDSLNKNDNIISLFLKYHYAVSLKNIHEFEKSKEIFNEFHKLDSNDKYINLQLSSIDSLLKWDSISFVEKIAPLEQVNSASSEFSTSFINEGIIYIIENSKEKKYKSKSINLSLGLDSLKKKEKTLFLENLENTLVYGKNLGPRTSVYKVPVNFKSLFCSDSLKDIPNSSLDSSQLLITHKGFNITSFSSDFNSKVFYTRHPNMNKWNPEPSVHPLLFQGILNSKRHKLTHRKRVRIKALSSSFGSGDVSVSSDGKSLYFASDKRKGEGGTDIYVAHKNSSGKWGKAINLGSNINTPFDEESPKIYDDSILYFSSNGHPGYGKADIFKCQIINDSVYNIQILPYPINSSGDDLHFDLHPFDESIGLLNSNRSGGKGNEDIYFASFPVEPYIKGYIKLAKDSSILEGAFVRLMDKISNEIKQVTTRINGVYRFSLIDGESYRITATKTGLAGEINVNANENLFRNERKDIFLHPAITIQGFAINEEDEGIYNASIEVFNEKDSLEINIKTDTNGFFQFKANENKEHLILAIKDKKIGSQKVITEENYKTDSIIFIKLFNTGANIKGIVIDTNGVPSNKAVVRLLDSNNIEIERITTDEEGEYFFSMSIYRNYRIVATNYGMAEDTSFFTGKDWGEEQTKNLYLKAHPTIQGYTYYLDTTTIIDEVKIDISKGIDANYISIFSDQKGFYQAPLFNDTIIILKANKNQKSGNTTIIIDSNYLSSSSNNIILHGKNTEVNGVVKYKNDSIAVNVSVELINVEGKWLNGLKTDSLGRFNFKLKMDKDYEIYCSHEELEAVENIHTGVLWNKDEDVILTLIPKGSATYGKVVDADDKTPLSFVKITLTDSSTNIKNITYTNDIGGFEMALRKNSVYTIKLERVDYFPKIIDVRIGDTIPKIIDLNKEFNLDLIKSGFKVEPIYFEFASHEITKHSKDELDILADILKERKNRTVTIFGYTDCRGDKDYNMILGKNRAEAVEKYLISVGINQKRIHVLGKGATNYVNNCYKPNDCTDADHRMNRRCEFQIDD